MSTSAISDVPIVQPPVPIEGFKMETNGQEFVHILEQKLKGLNITVMSHEEYSEDNNENHIDQLADMFANLDISNLDINNTNSINPVYSPKPIEKYYYKRPSPQDLLFEETKPFPEFLFRKSHL
ncbi:unnamed protein product [Lathyrus sativus]|nr:unnamed protein product [Lathyrus sativus]